MPSTAMLQTNVGTFLNAASSDAMSSGICCVAITNMVMAKANAASMNVSSRVISMPRKRNPFSRGNESKSVGNADAISSLRAFTPARHAIRSAPLAITFAVNPASTVNADFRTAPHRAEKNATARPVSLLTRRAVRAFDVDLAVCPFRPSHLDSLGKRLNNRLTKTV